MEYQISITEIIETYWNVNENLQNKIDDEYKK